MGFSPRLTQPDLQSIWWIHNSRTNIRGQQGINACIQIDGGPSVLPNCFTGETEILTSRGPAKFEDLRDGETVKILSIDNKWRPAIVTHYGLRPVVTVLIGTEEYTCTLDHRWPVYEADREHWRFVETTDLTKGMVVKRIVYDDIGTVLYHEFVEVSDVIDADEVDRVYCLEEPVTHTFCLASGIVTGNCTGWAWGRFSEIMGSACRLSTAAARRWFENTGDGYARGMTPQLGAVLCFGSGDDSSETWRYGHVCIVEKINSDGSIITSESGYGNAKAWWTSTRYPPNYFKTAKYTFQGFIYNPAVGASSTEYPDVLTESTSGGGGSGSGDGYSYIGTSTSGSSSSFVPIGGSTSYQYSRVTPVSEVYNPNSREHSEALHAGRIVSNPPKVEKFLQSAEELLNKGSSSATSVGSNQAWSAAFISDLAKSSGVSAVIPTSSSCTKMASLGVANGQGSWISGQSAQPQVGDIAFFRTNSVKSDNPYQSDFCGVVTQVNGSKFTVIQGNVSGEVKKKEYLSSNTTINGYYRPNYTKVDSTYQAGIAHRTTNGVYTNQTNMIDATMREVGYLNDGYKPSIIPSGLKLSVINYTGLIKESYAVFKETLVPETPPPQQASNVSIEDVSSQVSESISALVLSDSTPAENATFNYLIDKGLNAAVACGICANIKAESNFRTGAIGDKNTSFGICQWHKGRGTAMKSMAGENWANNLTGQLDYLWHELGTKYKFVLNSLNTCPNTLAGAKQAADIFVRKFEVPANADSASLKRQANAEDYWRRIISQY